MFKIIKIYHDIKGLYNNKGRFFPFLANEINKCEISKLLYQIILEKLTKTIQNFYFRGGNIFKIKN